MNPTDTDLIDFYDEYVESVATDLGDSHRLRTVTVRVYGMPDVTGYTWRQAMARAYKSFYKEN